jgi:hypothetical protein
VRVRRRETEGKRAGDDAHLHAELQQRAGVMERRDGGVPKLGSEGGGATRVGRQKAAAAGCAEPRARGGGFIGRPRASACAPGGVHAAARLRFESKPGSCWRLGMTPAGGPTCQ